MIERPQHRMTLRQLMTHSEKVVRDLLEHLNTVLLPREQDFRDLSRPIRHRSHYPTLLALHNALENCARATRRRSRRPSTCSNCSRKSASTPAASGSIAAEWWTVGGGRWTVRGVFTVHYPPSTVFPGTHSTSFCPLPLWTRPARTAGPTDDSGR